MAATLHSAIDERFAGKSCRAPLEPGTGRKCLASSACCAEDSWKEERKEGRRKEGQR